MRIVVAEDHVLLREGLAQLLRGAGHDVVATAADHDELVERTLTLLPDAVITDIRMPPTHTREGFTAARALRAALPGLPVLLLSQYVDAASAAELLPRNAGAIGYLLKQRVFEVDTFLRALDTVAEGGTVVDAEIRTAMDTAADTMSTVMLTAREVEVLVAIAEGRTNREIAVDLALSPKTVMHHTTHIFRKLGVRGRAEAVARGIRAGLVSADPAGAASWENSSPSAAHQPARRPSRGATPPAAPGSRP